jgi:hypothetical protein
LVDQYFVNLVLLQIWSTLTSSICEYSSFLGCATESQANCKVVSRANDDTAFSRDCRMPPGIQVPHCQPCRNSQQTRLSQWQWKQV